jgi:hypothetical protein
MKIKLLKLYIDYYLFTAWNKLACACIRPWLRYYHKANFDAVREINSNFELCHDLAFASLWCRWLRENLTYKDTPKTDYAKEPVQTLYDRTYNCNDFSRLIVCVMNWYKPWIPCKLMIVQAEGWRGHAVAILEIDGKFIHISNWGVFIQKHETLEALASAVYDKWDYYVLYNENMDLKKVVIRS